MLSEALAAKIPLVTCTTRDTVNVQRTLMYLLKRSNANPTLPFGPETEKLVKGEVYYCVGPARHEKTDADLYKWFETAEATLVIVNPASAVGVAHDVGVLDVPEGMVRYRLKQAALDEEEVEDALLTVGGLNLTELAHCIRLASAEHHEVTPQALADVRRRLFRSGSGLSPLEALVPGYVPDPFLRAWADREGPFLVEPDAHPELRPRGLLFDGPPGTGKSVGARFLAHRMGVPIFRIEMSGLKHKYVGESEKGLANTLQEVERQAPCVVLWDEMEKLFSAQVDQGVTSGLLGALLTWMADHRSRVLTVLTTNNKDALPAELIRAGRVDQTVVFEGLLRKEAEGFGKAMLSGLGLLDQITQPRLEVAIDDAFQDPKADGAQLPWVAHSALKQELLSAVKASMLAGA